MVDYVFNGSRFKLYSEKENCFFFFTCGGAVCPQTARPNDPKSTAEPFSEEARLLAREHLMQREVTISIHSCNRGGTFIGQLWTKFDGQNTDFGEHLLTLGYAAATDYLDMMPSASRLREAEAGAFEKKLGIWSIEENRQVQVDTNVSRNVVEPMGKVQIVHINSIDEFFVQPVGANSSINRIMADVAEAVNGGKAGPLAGWGKNTNCLAQFSADNQWYRARIDGRIQGGVKVTFIDFGNSESVGTDKLKALPAHLSTQRCAPQATKVALNMVETTKEYSKYCSQVLQEWANEGALDCTSERTVMGKKMVVLKPANGLSVNEEYVKEGLAMANPKYDSSIKKSLMDLMADAKKDRIGIWEHGDIQDDGDDEAYW
jgi:endonuclease YncB( thermonuclease family)